MKNLTALKKARFCVLCIMTLIINAPISAAERNNRDRPKKMEPIHIKVQNGQITGIAKDNPLKSVLESLSKTLGFSLESWDDLAEYQISQNYRKGDTLKVIQAILDSFNHVMILDDDLSIKKVLIMGVKDPEGFVTQPIFY